MNEASQNRAIERVQELKNDETLFKKVVKIAQFESELDLGVNPKSFDQAKVGNLTENDFEYIKKVCVLVEKRLRDPDWIRKTLGDIENLYKVKSSFIRGIRFDDELFKAGRGILETYLRDLKKDQ